MLKIKVKGADEIVSKLNKLSKRVEGVAGERSVSLSVLLNPDFIKNNTKFDNANDFFEKGGFDFNNTEEFEKIDESTLDRWVKSNSSFETWQEMLQSATVQYYKTEIGL